jgi:hypothetical protein
MGACLARGSWLFVHLAKRVVVEQEWIRVLEDIKTDSEIE